MESQWMENQLEGLERRLVLDDLSATEMRNMYVKEFLGTSVRDWLIEVENELARLHEAFITAVDIGKKRFSEVEGLDRKLNYEIAGRRQEICDSIYKPFCAYKDYSTQLAVKLKHLVGQLAFASTKDLLKQVVSDWESQLGKSESRYRDFCASCNQSAAGAELDKCRKVPTEKI
jgi:hypothetical protein